MILPLIIAASSFAPVLSVHRVQAIGTGCTNFHGHAVAFGDSVLHLDMDGMTARTGSGTALSEARRFCQFVVQVEQPAGWTYALEGADVTVDSYLAAGTYGIVAISSYFQGSGLTLRAETEVKSGAFGSRYEYVDLGGWNWAPCGASRALNVKTEVQARGNRRAFGRLGLLGDVFLTLRWKKC